MILILCFCLTLAIVRWQQPNMAEEETAKKMANPKSLYKQCLETYVSNLNYNVNTLDRVNYLRLLPPILLADIYVKMSRKRSLDDMLLEQLVDLDIFARLLRFSTVRQKLFRCVSSLVSSGKPFASQLQIRYVMKYSQIAKSDKCNGTDSPMKTKLRKPEKSDTTTTTINEEDMDAIDFGLRLGSFLSEAGLLSESINILTCVADTLEKSNKEFSTLLVRLDCLQRLLHSEAVVCSFKNADRTYNTILELVRNIGAENIPHNLLANIYTQLSVLFFSRSEYDHSHNWSVLALKKLTTNTPEKIIIDVLRQAAKACVVKRQFKRANMLICHAVRRARITFGTYHQKYADALLDYGFFLLNVDSVHQSVSIYKDALSIKREIFGNRNFHVAIAHEDLSYAYYVHEYSSGDFQYARENVDRAIDIMQDLVPSNHLMLASAKRVKALLLEEIALDKMASSNGIDEDKLLLQSEELHKSALDLSLESFGEINVQTAKHYGNLGRLYQSMCKFEEAEEMHKKAIKIKTDLLGPYDYEVGLSIGHLASLYNYHMKKYRDAEELYLKSIEISLRLFGKTYSGLEYDYLGLCHVYETLQDIEKYLEYASILENWQVLREGHDPNKQIYPESQEDITLEDLTRKFFEMCSDAPVKISSSTSNNTASSNEILVASVG